MPARGGTHDAQARERIAQAMQGNTYGQKHSAEVVARVQELARAGVRAEEIAQQTGVSHSWVLHLAAEVGVRYPTTPPRDHPWRKSFGARLYQTTEERAERRWIKD